MCLTMLRYGAVNMGFDVTRRRGCSLFVVLLSWINFGYYELLVFDNVQYKMFAYRLECHPG